MVEMAEGERRKLPWVGYILSVAARRRIQSFVKGVLYHPTHTREEMRSHAKKKMHKGGASKTTLLGNGRE